MKTGSRLSLLVGGITATGSNYNDGGHEDEETAG